MKSVIVTGGTGFIGRSLVNRLRERLAPGEEILAPGSSDVDLVNRERALEWFERLHWMHDVSHIFHLAAVYRAGGWPETHPGTQFHANMQINLSVLEGWKRFFPKARLTSVVSYCMYPDHGGPHTEAELWGTEPEPYLFAYAFTKKALLIGQKAYCREFGLEASALVLPTVYGPGGNFSETSHVIGALIGKFAGAVEAGEDSVEVWGDGRQEREFIHVRDVVEGLLLVATSPIRSEVLNLGTSRATSIRELVDIIRTCVGFEGDVQYLQDRFIGALKRVLDSGEILRTTSWRPRVELEDGVREVVNWYRSKRTISD